MRPSAVGPRLENVDTVVDAPFPREPTVTTFFAMPGDASVVGFDPELPAEKNTAISSWSNRNASTIWSSPCSSERPRAPGVGVEARAARRLLERPRDVAETSGSPSRRCR
jgi:hypothetical protein